MFNELKYVAMQVDYSLQQAHRSRIMKATESCSNTCPYITTNKIHAPQHSTILLSFSF